jgi:carboxymethylenebutenolidase
MPDVEVGPVVGGSDRLKGYVAVPEGGGPWPGVVVLHEALGVNDIVRRQTDRIASAGYVALAPDLFSDGGAARCLMTTFRALFAGRGKAIADIDAAREYLKASDKCTGKVGVVGFCMGGGFALVTANRGFDVAAPNYGQLPRSIETALTGACPIVASYGGKDVLLRGAANKLTRTLHTLEIEHDVKEYPDAAHCFLNDRYFGRAPAQSVQRILNVGPNPEAAADAWRRIEEFFARHLAG